jgi:hypothetical protein
MFSNFGPDCPIVEYGNLNNLIVDLILICRLVKTQDTYQLWILEKNFHHLPFVMNSM